ncbi:23S rRNA (guanine(745)-N(1))-methyltransferase [Vibrio sp. SS-MA-C1-2]|uniref:23S rRNA (guanine(745)-N(1))-methyltransferase n=1 Tax=Vibrio sp. SS-MA-C1-2 TaxID=2908646 RepID=UPI001F321B64|nr:23S rRNA (guanine(745)-N(1))-methyltransferase [Vibrio sp. SS-MA-C1-2]UJF18716.1 23S rRNA (guanine(745)-N(1))-methyltransferase [Vibrio sp. SS-MA-C1-2]
MSFQCPLCFSALNQNNHHWVCENNHQFDLAKEGYVNLMPAHHKRSKNPGDNKEMMQARRAFLENEHYQPLRQAVIKEVTAHLETNQALKVLDIGCGEGYYTSALATKLQEYNEKSQVYGLDISKVAIKFAAKRYPQADFCVASSHRLPFADNSLDGIVRIYAPCKAEELSRVIKSDGIIVTVTPAARHLYQLKEKVYQSVKLHETQPEEIAGFELIKQTLLPYSMDLNSQDATALLQMTPFAWRASEQVWQQLEAENDHQIEADFSISIYRKK